MNNEKHISSVAFYAKTANGETRQVEYDTEKPWTKRFINACRKEVEEYLKDSGDNIIRCFAVVRLGEE